MTRYKDEYGREQTICQSPLFDGNVPGSREPLRQIVQQPILLSFPDRNKLAFGCILPYDYSIISINLL